MGGQLGWYVFGSNFMDVIGFKEEAMNPSEDLVGFDVPMSSIPPSFHDTSIVAIYNEVVMR